MRSRRYLQAVEVNDYDALALHLPPKQATVDIGGQADDQTTTVNLLTDALDIHPPLAWAWEDPPEVLCEGVCHQL